MKTGKDRDVFSSYRPICNTPFLSKVQEITYLKHPNDHLSKKSALQKLQSSYRRNHSVETAVTIVYTDLIIINSRGEDPIHVLLDLGGEGAKFRLQNKKKT